MKKTEISVAFRRYVKANLSPTPEERELVTSVYASLQNVLGDGRCIQIGSYPRFTSITPVHDLDVLYVIGKRDGNTPNPSSALDNLERQLNEEFDNPTPYEIAISRQTHSITIAFIDDEEFFSVDVVPAYIAGRNEFGLDTYIVPEIITKTSPGKRKDMYQKLAASGQGMAWISSDPRGYIKIASDTDAANSDFRKAVKFVKAWRCACKEAYGNFKLKSFHLERYITNYFRQHPDADIFDAVFTFFTQLPAIIAKPSLPDRPDVNKYVDAYVADLTEDEKKCIIEARDHFLIKLEAMRTEADVAGLLRAGRHHRASSSEQYLFDFGIPVCVEDDEDLRIRGKALSRKGGFTEDILDAMGIIEVDREIEFQMVKSCNADQYRWKVKNADHTEQPRGEITVGHTLNSPEITKYNGKHFVECYAIKKGVCIAVARQNVELRRFFG